MEDVTPELRLCLFCAAPLPEGLAFCSQCGAAVRTAVDGDPLLEKLRALFGTELQFERELGRGGMAVVYSAFDPGLQRRVAVKALLPELAAEAGMTERFLREARTVASLHHPHVVSVYSVRANAEVQAIVMQYVDGRSLDALLAERSPLPLHVAGMILAQVADGLQHAHDRGVVHRDVKPANVLLDREGRAVVSDFGIARRDSGPRMTATGMVIGTWAYMSPEQRSGDPTTAATDQYAFGVMAFELLAGRLPFIGTAVEILRAHLNDPPPSLREFRPEVPAGVEALIQRMLAKKPEDRLPSLREAQHALRTLVTDGEKTTQILAALSQVRGAVTLPPTIRKGEGASVDVPAAPARRVEEDAARTTVATRQRSRLWTTAAFVGAACVVAALAVWAATLGSSRLEPAASSPSTAASPSSSAPGGEATVAAGAPGNAANVPAIAPPAPSGTAPSAGSTSAKGVRVATPGASGTVGAGAGATDAQAHTAAQSRGANVSADSTLPTESPAASAGGEVTRPQAAPDAAAGARAIAATLADARRIAREFVTMLNQRRYREVAQLARVGGDATLRDELIRLTQNAPDFEAGFDRVASAPETTKGGFTTEFTLDLAWRGGKKLLLIQAHATLQEDAWHLSGIGVEASQ